MIGKRVGLVVLALLLLAMAVSQALADGPVLWKQFCPRWHELVYVPEKDGSGMNVLCVLADRTEEVVR